VAQAVAGTVGANTNMLSGRAGMPFRHHWGLHPARYYRKKKRSVGG